MSASDPAFGYDFLPLLTFVSFKNNLALSYFRQKILTILSFGLI